jgi:iron(III) transport system substrate-binding protein
MTRSTIAAVLVLAASALAIALLGAPGCSPPAGVTVYTSVDDEVAVPLLARFEKETGIKVDAVTDTEATKTIGLASRLIEEGRPGGTPRADIFWNNEPVWTVRAAESGALEKYDSPAAKDVPAEFRDPKGFWTANGFRARLYIANSGLVKDHRPSSYADLADPAFKEMGAIARPTAGTCLSHLAALRAHLGAEAFSKWLKDAAANGTAFASGNGAVAREVGRGTRSFGFTDTDDFQGRRAAGDPVEAIFPDQGPGQPGTFILPVTVSLVRGAPHRESAVRLYDWLVSAETEAALSASVYATIPVRPTTKPGSGAFPQNAFRAAKPDWNRVVEHIDPVTEIVKEILAGK